MVVELNPDVPFERLYFPVELDLDELVEVLEEILRVDVIGDGFFGSLVGSLGGSEVSLAGLLDGSFLPAELHALEVTGHPFKLVHPTVRLKNNGGFERRLT